MPPRKSSSSSASAPSSQTTRSSAAASSSSQRLPLRYSASDSSDLDVNLHKKSLNPTSSSKKRTRKSSNASDNEDEESGSEETEDTNSQRPRSSEDSEDSDSSKSKKKILKNKSNKKNQRYQEEEEEEQQQHQYAKGAKYNEEKETGADDEESMEEEVASRRSKSRDPIRKKKPSASRAKSSLEDQESSSSSSSSSASSKLFSCLKWSLIFIVLIIGLLAIGFTYSLNSASWLDGGATARTRVRDYPLANAFPSHAPLLPLYESTHELSMNLLDQMERSMREHKRAVERYQGRENTIDSASSSSSSDIDMNSASWLDLVMSSYQGLKPLVFMFLSREESMHQRELIPALLEAMQSFNQDHATHLDLRAELQRRYGSSSHNVEQVKRILEDFFASSSSSSSSSTPVIFLSDLSTLPRDMALLFHYMLDDVSAPCKSCIYVSELRIRNPDIAIQRGIEEDILRAAWTKHAHGQTEQADEVMDPLLSRIIRNVIPLQAFKV